MSARVRRYSPGDAIGSMRAGCVLDYSGIVVEVSRDGSSLRARFSDGATLTVSTHPDFTFPMRLAYSYAAKFLAESDARGGVELTDASFARLTAGCVRPPGLSDTARALWVLRYDPEGARQGRPVAFAQTPTMEGR